MMQNNSLNLSSAVGSGGLASGYIPNQFTPAPTGYMPNQFTPVPAPVTVNVGASAPVDASTNTQTQDTQTQGYSPQEKQANATFADTLNKSINTNTPMDSSILSGPDTSKTVVSSADKAFQDYLTKQKSYQDKILGAITPSQAEQDLITRQKAQKIQAMQNQEIALNSGETSSFAGGEAQRVARNDAFKSLILDSQVQTLADQRATALKGLELLSKSNDNSYEAQVKYQTLQNTVSGVDKQAQDTVFNLQQSNPTIPFVYDKTKTPIDNLTNFRTLLAQKTSTQKSYQSDPTVSSLYNLGLITGGTEAERQARANSIASLPQTQKDLVIQGLAYSSLGPTQKTNFEANQRASQLAQNAISIVPEDMVNNPYKYTANQYITFLGGKKDPQYTNFIQNVQSVVAPIRLSYFGASLTTGEQTSANQFLPDTSKDDTKTLILKLKNVDSIARFTNDVMISNALGTPRPNINDYITVNADGTPKKVDYKQKDAEALKMINKDTGKPYTQQEIDAYKQQRGFSSVGKTSASIEIPQTSRLAYVNNNPGNLRFVGQAGAVQGDGGFAKFPDAQTGFNALQNQIKLDSSRGLTLEQFINKYAPPTENNTTEYLKQATSTLGYTPNTTLSKIPVTELARFIALKESSTKIS